MILRDDGYWMQEALQEARIAYEEGEVPIGAVLVCSGKIIARAHNLVERLHDPTAHAEMLAITAATTALSARVLRQSHLYVTVEPCPMCAGAIRWAQIGAVTYGAREEKFGYQTFSSDIIPRKCQVCSGLLATEAQELMQTFFKERRSSR